MKKHLNMGTGSGGGVPERPPRQEKAVQKPVKKKQK